jgi:beta-xylosidase
MRAGQDYYAYGTSVDWRRPHYFPILRSPDLIHWRYVGDAFRRPPRWASDRHWAPAPLQRGSRTYLFYSARGRHGRHCVAVAVARRPAGPFHHRSVIACGRPLGYIDPFPLVEPDGSTWLYFARADPTCRAAKPSCFISVLPLTPDLERPAGPRQIVLGVSEPWETRRGYQTVENPFVFEAGGVYYLLYSANDWRTADYAMGYAVGPSPTGPFVKAESPFLSRGLGLTGPGGGSVVPGPDGGLWLVYHARRSGRPKGKSRILYVDPLSLRGGLLSVSGSELTSEP